MLASESLLDPAEVFQYKRTGNSSRPEVLMRWSIALASFIAAGWMSSLLQSQAQAPGTVPCPAMVGQPCSADPPMVYVRVWLEDCRKDTIAAVRLNPGDTVFTVLKDYEPLLKKESQRYKIWVSRPQSGGKSCAVLPVDWNAIQSTGNLRTNYPLQAGDRVFVACAILDDLPRVARIPSPWTRLCQILDEARQATWRKLTNWIEGRFAREE
jgi:hypothetical protein